MQFRRNYILMPDLFDSAAQLFSPASRTIKISVTRMNRKKSVRAAFLHNPFIFGKLRNG